MADVKISQLPAATTPLDGTELAPIVQSGTTKRVSVANLTVGRALTASSLTLTTPLSAANGGTGLTSLGTGIATFLGTPTSANLAAAVTDETGTGALVFASSPTIATPTLSTSFTSPLHIGGTTASSTLTLQSTSGVGTSDSIVFKVGSNGATTAGVFDTSGNLGIGTSSPNSRLAVAFSANPATDNGLGLNTLRAYTTITQAANTGGAISLGGLYSTSDLAVSFAQIAGRKENGNSGDLSGYLQIGILNAGGTMVERVRISSDGTFRVKGAGTAGSTDAVQFSGSAPASAMTLDASGNLAVGTASNLGGTRVHIQQNADANYSTTFTTATTKAQLVLRDSSAVGTYSTPFSTLLFGAGDSGAGWATITGLRESSQSSAITFGTASASGNPVERARIDSSGNLLVGTTSTVAGGKSTVQFSGGTFYGRVCDATASSGTRYHIGFYENGTERGGVTTNGSVTTYGGTSDYRLKENITPISNGLARVLSMKPSKYTWKDSGDDCEGFIAHELAEIFPYAVVGEKDGPKMQMVDYGKLTPLLTAAIQELAAKVSALEAKQ